MLARTAADLYWMGRYLERTEQTARLLRHQLSGLPDTPADELALGWRCIYRTLGQIAPDAPLDADEAEVFLVADAYTLAGTLIEDHTNQDSLISCWRMARENATQLRPQLPLDVWTTLNQGYLWLAECDFPRAWSAGPTGLASEAIGRLRLLAGVVESSMARDDAWRFLELGRFVERLQHQTTLLSNWERVGRRGTQGIQLQWADLLRVCAAYELYCRRHTMTVRGREAMHFMLHDPEAPRSLCFVVRSLEALLTGIDPLASRHPLAPPHRMVLRLAATLAAGAGAPLETDETEGGTDRAEGELLRRLAADGAALHDLIIYAYVAYPITKGLPR
ncbi:MAG: alpha-E domain-containing protein [Gemmatimonadetes bacterium]|nr:alpha-E domain-containing protein [Gemmatimonadota bacterium]MCY3944397.1 alpha-E domain-containing protein [Gemmatimonadota bacterium]